MTTPKQKLWPLEPHTRGKHLVLKNYLDAWFPIMSTYNGRILFIDGFAGPGEYQGGEVGSPIIAIRSLKEHKAKNKMDANIMFCFIEENAERANHLERLVQQEKQGLPPNCKTIVKKSRFDAQLTKIFDELDEEGKNLAPAFVMIDPFGVSDTPMEIIQRIFRNNKCEVYISFMYDAINRFKGTSDFESHLNALYGCKDWKEGLDIEDGTDRKKFLLSLYRNQLKKAGARFVVHFELYEGNRLVYAIFFGTQSEKGCERMKQAIWKVDPFGNYTFHGTNSPQLILDPGHPDVMPLRATLIEKFKGNDYVGIDEILTFVSTDETDFHSGHVKKLTLIPMERDGLIEVLPASRKKKLTYPRGTRIKFL